MSDVHEKLAAARQAAQIAQTLHVPLEADAREMLRLLGAIEDALAEMDRLRAEVKRLRGQLDYCLQTVGDAAVAALDRP